MNIPCPTNSLGGSQDLCIRCHPDARRREADTGGLDGSLDGPVPSVPEPDGRPRHAPVLWDDDPPPEVEESGQGTLSEVSSLESGTHLRESLGPSEGGKSSQILAQHRLSVFPQAPEMIFSPRTPYWSSPGSLPHRSSCCIVHLPEAEENEGGNARGFYVPPAARAQCSAHFLLTARSRRSSACHLLVARAHHSSSRWLLAART